MKYLYHLLLIFLIGCILSAVAYKILYRGYYKYSVLLKKNEALFTKKINADYLLVGSSRMYEFVNPKIIEKIIGGKAYNVGTHGANLNESLIILRTYLQRNIPPKLIVLDLIGLDGKQHFSDHKLYLPYMKNELVYTALKKDGIKVQLYKIFPFLTITEYNDAAKAIYLRGLLGKTELGDRGFFYNGFANANKDTVNIHHQISKTHPILKNQIDTLHSFIQICKKQNINLLLTYAPEYNNLLTKQISNADTIFATYKKISEEYNLPFINQSNLNMCKNGKYFYDIAHLNAAGAQVYSHILGNQIRNLFPDL